MPNVQMSMFDIGFTVVKEKVAENKASFTKTPNLDAKTGQSFTNIINKNSKPKTEKVKKPLELTPAQQKFLDKNEVLGNESLETLSRIIICSCGWMAIEGVCKELNICSTTYINAEGQTEFIMEKKSSVLPNERILYHKTDFGINDIQKQKLSELKEKYQGKIKRIIHRHGDENILVEVPGKLLDIIPKGWVLEFTETTHVNCSQDEVLEDFQTEQKDVGQLVQPGDYVEAIIGKSIVKGTITHEYGLGNCSLCIDFEKNGTMYSTAIPRFHVKTILGKSRCVFWQYKEDSIIYFCPRCKKLLNNHEVRCNCGQEIDWRVKAMCEDKIKTS